MIDAGADLVLGHSPHVPRALELHKGKLIAYSLGNFMGYWTLSTDGNILIKKP
jgi:poly-gamma-glutamate capsule biosynthesis protein CapA/YwtB (metallophosphatase superfamily)